MREILFKAKRKDNGEWTKGYYLKRFDSFGNEQHLIFESKSYTVWEYAEIEPDTICQHTGLVDKNGAKIWENDIAEIPRENVYFVCKWKKDDTRFVLNGDGLTVSLDKYWAHEIEVIGNVFDNAELLEVE